MASSYSAILADIKSKLESIQNIGVVYDYYRWVSDLGKFILLFAYSQSGGAQHIRGWEVTRISVSEHKKGAYFRHHVFRISGYMGLKDADGTDKTFQALVDDVCEKFRTASGGTGWEYRDGDNPDNSSVQVNFIDSRTFGNVLCHCAEISLSVTERIIA